MRIAPALTLVLALALPTKGRAEYPTLEQLRSSFHRPEAKNYLAQNPYTKDKELLGKTLFFDPRLSGTNTLSCASCHDPKKNWSDGRMKAIGFAEKELERRSPSLWNVGYGQSQMWDGRSFMLEQQALLPLGNKDEMHADLDALPAKLKAIAGYRQLFQKAFPGQEISMNLITQALGVFERGIVSAETPFDKWAKGDDAALGDQAKAGLLLFAGKARCTSCHSGWRFTDEAFHDLGLKGSDKGRGRIMNEVKMQYAFKTPGLRNVSQGGPYMHNGRYADLMAVIEFYDRGGDVFRPSLDRDMYKLNLTQQEKEELISFLNSLTSTEASVALPAMPR